MDVAQNRPADSIIVLDMRLSGHVQCEPFDTAAVHAAVRRIYDTGGGTDTADVWCQFRPLSPLTRVFCLPADFRVQISVVCSDKDEALPDCSD